MIGTVVSLHRYPVKSMRGESLPAVDLTAAGLAGDRRAGLVDVESGRVVSAKDPRRWSGLLQTTARCLDGDRLELSAPGWGPVRSDDADVDAAVSEHLGRPVRLTREVPDGALYDDVLLPIAGVVPESFVDESRTGTTDEGEAVISLSVGLFAPGTFQDLAAVTVITTASLRRLGDLLGGVEPDPERFRMNVVIDVPGEGFVENDWSGRTLRVGGCDLSILSPAPRCIMVTLPQDGLAKDREVLRALAEHNRLDLPGFGVFACLGAYAGVETPGTITVGDAVELS